MSSERTDISGATVHSQEQQQSGMPPMGMPSQDRPSPRSGEPSYPTSGAHYPPPPPPSGPPGGYSGPPPPQPYAAAQQTQSYQPPPPGAFPPQGFPPYGMFPPHMFHPGAPPPFGQQPPFYGFPGYPVQHQRPLDGKSSGRRKSPTRRNRSPRRPYNSRSSPDEQQAIVDIPSVKPMKSAFHFFAQEMMDSLRQAAEDEVRDTNNGKVDLYLVNTNLNGRLTKAWEDASQILREEYMEKEEEDRKRFMADDEIASRHCATLTARARSPQFGRTLKKEQKNDGDEDDEEEGSYGSGGSEESEKKRDSPTENGESPTKKIRTDEDETNGEDEATAAV